MRSKTSILKSPVYRMYVGKQLKEKRQELGYSFQDMFEMTGIVTNTSLNLEKGNTTNMDYYVEYAKALNCNLPPLSDAGIDLRPTKELSKQRKERTQLTLKIRNNIILSGFLKTEKTTEQIIDELIKLQLLTKGQVTSTEVAGVLRNFVEDETIKVVGKMGNKNLYRQGSEG